LSLAKNVEFLSRLPKLNGFNGFGAYGFGPDSRSPLAEVSDFGSNPGALRMFSFVPDSLQKRPALVVVLHGCGQTAAGYDVGTGWSALANRYGFALLMPEQRASNNANTCFSWFNPTDTAREQGEARSIRQMIARMVRDHKIDPNRIYITGLSAGGAMTSVMLATYPEVFAGGAIIAGLPFGVAGNVREALSAMMQPQARPARQLGDLVRSASKHKGPWPKLSVWHGTADHTVNPVNADEIVKQWLDVHRLPQAPMATGIVDGYPHQVWWNADGATTIESYTITDMGHGTPLGIAENDERYGMGGAFLIEAGISSSYHIANFFGVTGRVHQPTAVAAESPSAKLIPSVSPLSVAVPDLAKARRSLVARDPHQERRLEGPTEPRSDPVREKRQRRVVDVSAVITRALTAAGLMKDGSDGKL
jgi:poly(hydroxyalkanoate) depolymerase family esterase